MNLVSAQKHLVDKKTSPSTETRPHHTSAKESVPAHSLPDVKFSARRPVRQVPAARCLLPLLHLELDRQQQRRRSTSFRHFRTANPVPPVSTPFLLLIPPEINFCAADIFNFNVTANPGITDFRLIDWMPLYEVCVTNHLH